MRQLAENPALALKPLNSAGRRHGKIQELDCYAPIESAVAAFG